jgi:hypothetical protein
MRLLVISLERRQFHSDDADCCFSEVRDYTSRSWKAQEEIENA